MKKKCTAKNSPNTINCNVFTFIWTVHCFADTVFHRPTKNRMFLKFELSRLGKACKTKEPIFFLYIVRIKMEWKKSICHFQAICLRVFFHSQYSYAPWHLKLMFMFCGFNFFFKYAPHRLAYIIFQYVLWYIFSYLSDDIIQSYFLTDLNYR